MNTAVLFDFGNTLASYYRREEFHPILEQAIDNVLCELRLRNIPTVTREAAVESAVAANREAEDYRVIPMADRLARIFRIPDDNRMPLKNILCESFLSPVFATGRVYEDTIPVLEELRKSGYRTAIVSNTPWGSPPELWRRELRRLGLDELVDKVVFCGDIGWRKPAPQIFQYATSQLGVTCHQCLFVGDDLQWDIEGSATVGMIPVLMDRNCDHPQHKGRRINDLYGILEYCTSVMPRSS